jgi:hypothetical protein
LKLGGLLKSSRNVIPANAGIQNRLILLDTGFRWHDKNRSILIFYGFIKLNPNKTRGRSNMRMKISADQAKQTALEFMKKGYH